ncbi:recombinase family protein [Xenorhabdus bovienii]|uniref:Resolvase protein n=1 Tax=Xenorhabdus bovienii str. feltiae Moldova TaxID=1398200 RepID=A0A077NN15_XENBV|nr:recombinase family protein [Xenorhabdus bovienii]MCG3469742.1 recombinase family protein [Xenorhabdus bovienii]CDG89522.1 Resolvase protein [Xenorhabdus bovienii str. feltiae France]CDG92347.1 Resolvase protein [Xenorhabdus bovienii str. feltiae Florida]CDG99768.1 Resolvase protein [Xenorhabdus bovienii str. feltiae Moldova]
MNHTKDKNQIVKVAQYLRMSTEHQKYSIENQSVYIQQYAEQHSMAIIYTYDDSGKSGVTLSGRNAFKRLIADVTNRVIDIAAILVYDVSRFGRFPDPDEAAHYSYILKTHNVKIIYCAEPLSEDHPEISMLALPILRYGAASFSKNLSEKVFAGQANLIKQGYHQGGMAGYGLRRQLIDDKHEPKLILGYGQRKNIQTDRVILTLGPKDEIKIVNEIYDLFIFKNFPEYLIATQLNQKKIPAENNGIWTREKVHQILTNEKYIGNNIYNKTSFKLKQKFVKNPRNEWIRCDGAFKAIVPRKKFLLAQQIIQNRSKHLTNEDLLNYLRKKLEEKGKLSGFIIDEDDTSPSSSVFKARFGGLIRAYFLIGYKPEHDYSFIQINENLREKLKTILNNFIESIKSKNCIINKHENSLLNINDELSISLIISRCIKTKTGKLKWKVRFENVLSPEITIIIRMDINNLNPVDYYILPRLDIVYEEFVIKEKNPIFLELYRYDNLDLFFEIITRREIMECI